MGTFYDVEQDALYIQGMEKGTKKESKRTVIRCLNQGMTYESIVSITGLTIE